MAGVLYGPPIVFQKENKEMRTKYFELMSKLRHEGIECNEQRKIIEKALESYGETQPKFDQVALFKVGNKQESAIHSEPNINMDRFFFSIVPGNKEEIIEIH